MQSFRDALDHAVHAIACVHHQADPPPSDRLLSFPITEDAAKWKKFAKTLAKLLPLPVIDAIVRAQPWTTGDPALRWLNDLSNRAKHRSLHLMSLAQPASLAEITYVDGIEGLGPWLAPTGPLKVGEWKPIGGVMADVPLPPDMTANVGLNTAHVFHDLDDAKEVGEVFNAVADEVGRVLNVLQETLRGLT
ncbi:hypothetical protein ACFFKU_13035 [Kineococcus gynurae]|uniref:2-oxoacid dehydrogenase/acyltransferase catalytic subunit n=1 Tax=Kineococcus gynurae TaxID=452979 RepID=A0ABV5LQE2_9ACTN